MSVRSLNKVLLIGNLTRDPNLRYTPNGTAVCSFGLATNRTWTPADGGEKQEKVEFHNTVAWAKLAEICGQLLHKGDKVFVEGRMQTREWKSDDNQEKKITEVVIDNMMLLHSANGRSMSDQDGNMDPEAVLENGPMAQEVAVDEDASGAKDVADEIPF